MASTSKREMATYHRYNHQEAMNLKPDSFVKIFWHLALIAVFIMVVRFLMQIAGYYIGLS